MYLVTWEWVIYGWEGGGAFLIVFFWILVVKLFRSNDAQLRVFVWCTCVWYTPVFPTVILHTPEFTRFYKYTESTEFLKSCPVVFRGSLHSGWGRVCLCPNPDRASAFARHKRRCSWCECQTWIYSTRSLLPLLSCLLAFYSDFVQLQIENLTIHNSQHG